MVEFPTASFKGLGKDLSVKLGSNIASLMAQRRLAEGTLSLSRTYERLSSGQRINRASDDAAGLAIADSLNADVRVFNQGVRNLNDGLSLLNIADSALNELTGILVRIKELAEQSANGIYGTSQRQALDQEAQALRLEHNRILATSEFNGKEIFAQANNEVRLQDGYGVDGSLSITIGGEEVESESAIERVSLDSSGLEGNSTSGSASVSNSGQYVVFTSFASNLVPGDTNNRDDVFLRNRETGETSRISVSSVGGEGNHNSHTPSISEDARYIAFESTATNLVAGDTNSRSDIFVHDRMSGQTSRVSVSSIGAEGNNNSLSASISGDGRFVAFTSSANNLVAGDTNGTFDIFVHDRETGQTTRVSTDSLGNQSNGASVAAAISYDGRFVTFQSLASNLVGGDTNGVTDVFVHDRQTGETQRVSIDSFGIEGNGASAIASISDDGRYIAYRSSGDNLVAGDTNGQPDVFLHDRQTAETKRISVSNSGVESNGDSGSSKISGDGKYIVFGSSATNLFPDDLNGNRDIFIYSTESDEIMRLTDGNGASDGANISRNGEHIVFNSGASDIVSGDSNAALDVFFSANPLFGGTGLTFGPIDISTIEGALSTLTSVDSQLNLISSERGKLGAFQSRIEVARNVRTSISENSVSAESRIRDVDVAEESSKLIRLNILQEVTAAILARANLQPELALTLLGN